MDVYYTFKRKSAVIYLICRRFAMLVKSSTALSDFFTVYYTVSSAFIALCDFPFAPFYEFLPIMFACILDIYRLNCKSFQQGFRSSNAGRFFRTALTCSRFTQRRNRYIEHRTVRCTRRFQVFVYRQAAAIFALYEFL